MTEENLAATTNPNSSNTFTISYNPVTSVTETANCYVPYYTWPTYTYPSTLGYVYAQLTEQQLGDLEDRFRRVMRDEVKFLLKQVLHGLEDESDDEDEEA